MSLKIKLLGLICFIFASTPLIGSDVAWGESSRGLRLGLAFDTNSFTLGASVALGVHLTNEWESSRRMECRDMARLWKFTCVDLAGQSVPENQSRELVGRLFGDLAPHQAWKCGETLNKFVELNKPGHYQISVRQMVPVENLDDVGNIISDEMYEIASGVMVLHVLQPGTSPADAATEAAQAEEAFKVRAASNVRTGAENSSKHESKIDAALRRRNENNGVNSSPAGLSSALPGTESMKASQDSLLLPTGVVAAMLIGVLWLILRRRRPSGQQ